MLKMWKKKVLVTFKVLAISLVEASFCCLLVSFWRCSKWNIYSTENVKNNKKKGLKIIYLLPVAFSQTCWTVCRWTKSQLGQLIPNNKMNRHKVGRFSLQYFCFFCTFFSVEDIVIEEKEQMRVESNRVTSTFCVFKDVHKRKKNTQIQLC